MVFTVYRRESHISLTYSMNQYSEMTLSPKLIYRFTAIHSKIPILYFTDIEKNNVRIHRALKKINSQRNPRE